MWNRIPVPWLQGECECQTEHMKWLNKSCKLLNGIFSIYALYSCLWVGENDQMNKKYKIKQIKLDYASFSSRLGVTFIEKVCGFDLSLMIML